MNSRYPTLATGPFFTVGDDEQFFACVDSQHACVGDTFRYIFHKFKKGIYVKVSTSGEIIQFLPFNKMAFVSETPDFENAHLFFRKQKFTVPSKFWQNQNGLVRPDNTALSTYTNPSFETMFYAIKEAMDPATTTTTTRTVQTRRTETTVTTTRTTRPIAADEETYEFFLHIRDYPLITTGGFEPYDNIWDEETPLVSHRYDAYAPLLSMTTNDKFADIAVPTWYDFGSDAFAFTDTVPFEKKVAKIVFRGTSTGHGVTPETNPRIRVACLNLPFLDAGITKWNTRPRATGNVLQSVHPAIIKRCGTKPFLSTAEQARFKYVLDLPGHAQSFRITTLLRLNSIVFHVVPQHHTWLSLLIRPYVHYVPVRFDLSDLAKQYKWAESHPAKCRKILQNTRELASTHLTREALTARLGAVIRARALKSSTAAAATNTKLPFPEGVADDAIVFKSTKTVIYRDTPTTIVKHALTTNSQHEIEHERAVQAALPTDLADAFRLDNRYVPGRTLLSVLMDKNAPPSVNAMLAVLKVVTESYRRAYDACGFIHHDAVTWNVIMTTDTTPVLIDFGKSRVAGVKTPAAVAWVTDCPVRDVFSINVHVLWALLKYTTLNEHESRRCRLWAQYLLPHEFSDASCLTKIREFLDRLKKYDAITSYESTWFNGLHTHADYQSVYEKI